MLVLGDVNAPYVAWGYHKMNKKDVHNAAQQHRLALWNDPHCPTRIGNSVSRDTIPDHTSTGATQVDVTRLEEMLGSDHHIIQTAINHRKMLIKLGKAKFTYCDIFRKEGHPASLDDLEEWTKQIVGVVHRHTKNIQLSTDNPAADPRLLHNSEVCHSLLRRWK